MDPAVAIIIPCFNDDPGHLAESVAAAQAQDYANIEVVVVDDGSDREETRAALAALGVRIIRTENRGPAAARNTGIRSTSAELVLPLDADDMINPTFVSASVAILADPGVEIAHCDVREFGSSTRWKRPPSELWLKDVIQANRIAATALFRKSHWEAVGGYDEGLRNGFEDWELWVRMLRDGGMARKAPNAVLHYRQRAASRRATDLRLRNPLGLTREAIARNNSESLTLLLTAAWQRMDELESEVRRAWEDPLQMRRWLRWLKPILRSRQ